MVAQGEGFAAEAKEKGASLDTQNQRRCARRRRSSEYEESNADDARSMKRKWGTIADVVEAKQKAVADAKRQAKEEAERKAAAEKLMAERMAAEEKAKKKEEEKKHNEAVDGEESKSELADMKKEVLEKCSPGDAYNPTECDAACKPVRTAGFCTHASFYLTPDDGGESTPLCWHVCGDDSLALALQGTGAAWRAASAAAPTLWHRAFVEELKGEAPWLGGRTASSRSSSASERPSGRPSSSTMRPRNSTASAPPTTAPAKRT